jgi:hypothetical protein
LSESKVNSVLPCFEVEISFENRFVLCFFNILDFELVLLNSFFRSDDYYVESPKPTVKPVLLPLADISLTWMRSLLTSALAAIKVFGL